MFNQDNLDNQVDLDILEILNNKDHNHINLVNEIIQINNTHLININHKNNFIHKNNHQSFKKKKNHKFFHNKLKLNQIILLKSKIIYLMMIINKTNPKVHSKCQLFLTSFNKNKIIQRN